MILKFENVEVSVKRVAIILVTRKRYGAYSSILQLENVFVVDILALTPHLKTVGEMG